MTRFGSVILGAAACCVTNAGLAQVDHRWDHWYWGENNGWQFTADTVVPLDGSPMPLGYKALSLSDPYTGDLLLFSDLQTFWNAQTQTLPTGIGNFTSLGNAAHVIDKIGQPNERLLLFWGEGAGQTEGIWQTTIVLDANGGNGDLSGPATMALPDKGLRSCVIPAHTSDTTWLLVDEPATGAYYSYPITISGIGLPVLAYPAVEPNPSAILLKADRIGTRVVAWTHYNQRLDLFQFDRGSGLLSDTLTIWLDDIVNYTGFEFSPNGNVLYVAVNYSLSPRITDVLQYDLSTWAHGPVNASRTSVADTVPVEQLGGRLQLGPDDRIYVGRGSEDSTKLAVIMTPDEIGLGCDYRPNAIPLSGGRTIDFDVLTFPSIHWPIPLTNVGQNEGPPIRTESWTVYPMPAVDQAQVTIPSAYQNNAILRVFDAHGGLRRSQPLTGGSTVLLERGGLCRGLYMLELIRTDGYRIATRMVFADRP